MSPLVLVLIGMAIVLTGVLALRLHAFLALVIAAMVVAALTPRNAVRDNEMHARSVRIIRLIDDGKAVEVAAGMKQGLVLDNRLPVYRVDPKSGELAFYAEVKVESGTLDSNRCVLRLPPTLAEMKLLVMEKDDIVINPLDHLAAANTADKHFAERVAEGFGKTAVDIGILIALAAIVGECLLASGAAERIVRSTLRTVGEKRAPAAFLGSGFLLGIPVFFDTVFYLLIPLGKAMAARTGKNYLLYVLAIVAGATMTHSLVPPTPGPLFAASAFGVDVGAMILGGLVVSAATAVVGFAYALWANRRWEIPLRVEGGAVSEVGAAGGAEAEAQAMGGDTGLTATTIQEPSAALPPLWLSLLPIVLPVVLIAGHAVVEAWGKSLKAGDQLPGALAALKPALSLVGNKNVALLIAAIIAMLAQAGWGRGAKGGVNSAVSTAISSAGVVILITCAGGAFGAVLRQTGIASEVRELAGGWHLAILPLAFLVTALVRTAQGSATVAMITAAGIFAPLVSAGGLAFHPLYLALAVGCGSKPIMWMNDSGFWVITKMTGFRESETLKTATVMMLLMGLTGLAVVMIAAAVMPMK